MMMKIENPRMQNSTSRNPTTWSFTNATQYFLHGIPNKTQKSRNTFKGPNNLGTLFFHLSTIQISLANISLIQTCFAKDDHCWNPQWTSPFLCSQTPNHGSRLCFCKMYTMQRKLHILLLKNYHLFHLWAFILLVLLLSNTRLQQVNCKKKNRKPKYLATYFAKFLGT